MIIKEKKTRPVIFNIFIKIQFWLGAIEKYLLSGSMLGLAGECPKNCIKDKTKVNNFTYEKEQKGIVKYP